METACETHIPTQQTGAQTPPRVQKPHGDRERPESDRKPPRKGTGAPVRLRNGVAPLTASADFRRIARLGKKSVYPAFTMQALQRGEGPLRLGLTVSRKVGNAVVRNRVKRRLRETVRLSGAADSLAGWDIVLIGRTEAARQDFALLQRDFADGMGRLKRVG
jgi:ribonuclease P protein component